MLAHNGIVIGSHFPWLKRGGVVRNNRKYLDSIPGHPATRLGFRSGLLNSSCSNRPQERDSCSEHPLHPHGVRSQVFCPESPHFCVCNHILGSTTKYLIDLALDYTVEVPFALKTDINAKTIIDKIYQPSGEMLKQRQNIQNKSQKFHLKLGCV